MKVKVENDSISYFSSYQIIKDLTRGQTYLYKVEFYQFSKSLPYPKHAFLILYHTERQFKAHQSILSKLSESISLKFLFEYSTNGEFFLFFDSNNLKNLTKCSSHINEYSDIILIILLQKILKKIAQVNENGFFFKLLKQEDIYFVRKTENRRKTKFFVEDCEVRFFFRPEILCGGWNDTQTSKTIKANTEVQAIAVLRLFYEFLFCQKYPSGLSDEKILIKICADLSFKGYRDTFSKIFSELINREQRLYRDFKEMSQVLSSVALDPEIPWKDSVKLMKSHRVNKNSQIGTQSLQTIKLFKSGLNFKLLLPNSLKPPQKNNDIKHSKISFDTSMTSFSSRFISLPKSDLLLQNNNIVIPEKNPQQDIKYSSVRQENLISTPSSLVLNKNKKNSKSMTRKISPEKIKVQMTERSRNRPEEEKMDKSSRMSLELSARRSEVRMAKKSCFRCGGKNPETQLECSHWYHRDCLNESISKDLSTATDFTDICCAFCFKPINLEFLQDFEVFEANLQRFSLLFPKLNQ